MVGIINITVINPISAYLYEVYETLDYRFKTKNPKAVLFSNKGLWIREAVDDNTFLVLEAKSVRQEGDVLLLRTVSVLEMDRQSQLMKRVEAYAAELKGDKFELKDVRIYEAGQPVEKINNIDYKTTLTIDRIKENFIDPKQFRPESARYLLIFTKCPVLGAAASDALYVAVEFSLPAVCDAAGGGGVCAASQQPAGARCLSSAAFRPVFWSHFFQAICFRHQRLYSADTGGVDADTDRMMVMPAPLHLGRRIIVPGRRAICGFMMIFWRTKCRFGISFRLSAFVWKMVFTYTAAVLWKISLR